MPKVTAKTFTMEVSGTLTLDQRAMEILYQICSYDMTKIIRTHVTQTIPEKELAELFTSIRSGLHEVITAIEEAGKTLELIKY